MIQIFLALFIILISNANALAEVFKLKSGKTVEGKIVEETDDHIKLDSGVGVILTYYKDELEGFSSSVSKSTPTAVDEPKEDAADKKYSNDAQVNEILNKMLKNYRAMNSFRAEGKIISHMTTRGISTKVEQTFSILLARPGLYKIVWEVQAPFVSQSAVWNDGSGGYSSMGKAHDHHKKATSLEMDLAEGAEISGHLLTNTVENLFFYLSQLVDSWVDSIKITLLEDEEIEGEKCFHLEGKSLISDHHEFWISKERNVIVKEKYSVIKKSLVTEDMVEKEFLEGLKKEGLPPTDEDINKMKEFMQTSIDIKNLDIKGTHEAVYRNIEINPSLDQAAFVFNVPEGTTSKESILGDKTFNLDAAK